MTSDRFRVIERQFLPHPGTCAICGTNQRDMIDFGVDRDYTGVFLMCLECAREMVNVDELNLIRYEDVARLMDENNVMKRQMAVAVIAMEDMQHGLVASVDTYIGRVRSLTPEFVVDTEVSAEDEPPSQGDLGPSKTLN